MRLDRLRRTRLAAMGWALLGTGGAVVGRAQSLGSSAQLRDVPFKATQVVTREARDGTTVTRGRMARDGAGSTYVEMVDPRTNVATTAFLLDVPGHRGVVLDLVHKRYSVRPAPELRSRELVSGTTPELLRSAAESKGRSERETRGGASYTLTHLGTKLVSGLMSVGSAEVWPTAGGRRETETWFSVELGLFVRMTEVDGARQERTEVGLTEIVRTEPDPALFAIPRDFRLDDSAAGTPATALPGDPADGM